MTVVACVALMASGGCGFLGFPCRTVAMVAYLLVALAGFGDCRCCRVFESVQEVPLFFVAWLPRVSSRMIALASFEPFLDVTT